MADQDNMVERVAKAVCIGAGGSGASFDNSFGPSRAMYMRLDRTVIETMREPTEAMTDAGGQYWEHFNEDSATTVWQAMIDAALQGSE